MINVQVDESIESFESLSPVRAKVDFEPKRENQATQTGLDRVNQGIGME
jgi:hypothetical protein